MYHTRSFIALLAAFLAVFAQQAFGAPQPSAEGRSPEAFQYPETRALVALVDDAASLIEREGEAAFDTFRVPESRWRRGEDYIFVLDPDGNMLVHLDPALEGSNQLELEDVNGRPVVRGLLAAALTLPDKPEGWYHYQWPVPGGLLPRWKSSYVRTVVAPSGRRYVVGSGTYNDRMERAFVVDLVNDAVGQIERLGAAAYPLLRDANGPFMAKDTYVFVFDHKGIDLVNPGFPSLEGRELIDLEDAAGKRVIREMLALVEARDAGWVDYLWPKPGEAVSTQKSAYVTKARVGDDWVLVGSGVYLADAPKTAPAKGEMTAAQLTDLVRSAAAVFEQRGEAAYPEFREQGSRWLHDDVYFFVWRMDGLRVFHAANPAIEGRNDADATDVLGRPYGRMLIDAASSPSGEGWVHYMYPEPGKLFPMWKSTFVKQVAYPSGEQYLVGCGIYNMQMDKAFIEDIVDQAAALVEARGNEAFPLLRDRKGPFVFMDTYVFVQGMDGTELVNAGLPSLEGRNLSDFRDARGEPAVQRQLALAREQGSGWLEFYWYKPGDNALAKKQTFVRRVESDGQTYVVGSGVYLE